VDTCDVLVVGGGPAGSACAAALCRAGVDVVVSDAAVFPRDKVCAGWITPQTLGEIPFDADDYARTRTLQPITGFRVGIVGSRRSVRVDYGRPVSFGIRRCEFDTYLLRRSNARLRLGARVSAIRREGGSWIVGDAVRAAMLVGAGGHFCPVARMLNGAIEGAPVVAAQEVELPLERSDACAVEGETPELYFCDDFRGYGWCFRKGGFLNVGFGRIDATGLPAATRAFVDFLRATHRIDMDPGRWPWRGHAYRLAGSPDRRVAGDAVVLAGDAAGLAYPQSGEGIRPAIESGLLAAAAILDARGDYRAERLASYPAALRDRFASRPAARAISRAIPPSAAAACGRRLIERRWFVRRVVLDRWFLHARTAPVAAARAATAMDDAA
jgi:flavin-dependent dehydrogenase